MPTPGGRIVPARSWDEPEDDPLDIPELYADIRSRRVLAYLIDIFVVVLLGALLVAAGALFVLLTFGAASPLLALALALLPLAYHTFTIGGPANATVGMRIVGLRVVCWNGHRPGYVQAFVQTALFYFSLAVASVLILLVALFNDRGRCLHDYLSGCVVVNALPADLLTDRQA